MAIKKHTGSLQRRIAEGKAEPISDLERAQLQQFRDLYFQRFGKRLEDKQDLQLGA